PSAQQDGRQAWTVVCGAFCATLCTFGSTTGFGVFQAYYESDLLKTHSASQIGWIAGIQYCLLFLLGLPTGLLHDRGYTRYMIVIGSVIAVIAQLCVGWCTQYWQFILVQGIIFATGTGLVFNPVCASVPAWFDNRRNMALGVMAMGSGLGGSVYSIMAASLLDKVGFPWTCRALALLMLCLLSVCCLLVRPFPRRPPPPTPSTIEILVKQQSWIQRNLPYILLNIGTFLASAGVYLPVNYANAYVDRLGLTDPSLRQYLVAIINGTSLIGRLSAGHIADLIGPIIVMAAGVAACGIMCFFWTKCLTPAAIIVFAVVYGIVQGAYVALLPAGAAHIRSRKLGRSIGITFSICSISILVSPSIFGAIIS
ncbi:hypothetical protein TREMEDRAFT_22027, partial [Tremella mesenterica DSM 1558]|uniref:uncharacterized protein n=1 Tax=Tremella mesenterica (strain ATCC 24925 / CBS 8224 / DSM 1558 / NBRC 9311 / NRRL Y-6157 / RJB 2259-6 / UBC 559-6) TaxID=578456 RepID=UPI0003F4A607